MLRNVLLDEDKVIKTTFTNAHENIVIIVTRDTYDAVPKYMRERFINEKKWEWEKYSGPHDVPAGEVVLELEDFDWSRHSVRMTPLAGKGRVMYKLDRIIERIRPAMMDYGHME
jgi:hypothetical protein